MSPAAPAWTGTLSVVSETEPASPLTRPLVIAIDGPSGSGKSSTARGVAARLGLDFLDTGAMYRAATWLVLESGVAGHDSAIVTSLVADAEMVVRLTPDDFAITINGTDVTQAIRAPKVSAAVSSVAKIAEVRADLVGRQQRLIAAATGGIVVEGRDITTVVAPQAPVRILLVAEPNARVARRHAELGGRVATDAVVDQVIRRDRDDSAVAEFTAAAPGVVVVDSTQLSLPEVIDRICALTLDSGALEESGALESGA